MAIAKEEELASDEVELNEQELFDAADKEGEAPEVEAEAPPAPEPEPEPQPEEPAAPHNVPLQAMLEEREKRQRIQQQFEAMQQQMQQREAWEAEQQRLAQEQQELPDMFESPEFYQQGYHNLQTQVQMLSAQLQQQQQMTRMQHLTDKGDRSLERVQAKDPETFGKAWETLETKVVQQGDPSWKNYLLQTAMQGGDVGEALVGLYKQENLATTVGDDPDAYVESKLEEKLNDPEFLQKALEKARGMASGSEGQSVVKLPPSINKAGGAGGGAQTGMSDAELWDETLK